MMETPPALPTEPFRISWNKHGAAQRNAMLAACHRPSLQQAPFYASALYAVEGTQTDFGLIRFNEQPIGMVAVTGRRGLFSAACRLDRGPAWIHAEIPPRMATLVYRDIRKRYRWWRGRSLAAYPELPDTDEHRKLLTDAGFRRIAPGYKTIWLDLSPPLDELRADLHGNWRNQLVQAEEAGLELAVDPDTQTLDWLIGRHEAHMKEHGYRGPSGKLLHALVQAEVDGRLCCDVLVARHRGENIAGALIARHGRAATYLIGWTGEKGRDLRAQNFLLWQSVTRLHSDNIAWFDLGGINDETPGLTRFKAGLGGEVVETAGGYV